MTSNPINRRVSSGCPTPLSAVNLTYLKLSCFLHSPLAVWSHIFTGCSQGGKVTFGNMLCTFKKETASSMLSFPLDNGNLQDVGGERVSGNHRRLLTGMTPPWGACLQGVGSVWEVGAPHRCCSNPNNPNLSIKSMCTWRVLSTALITVNINNVANGNQTFPLATHSFLCCKISRFPLGYHPIPRLRQRMREYQQDGENLWFCLTWDPEILINT